VKSLPARVWVTSHHRGLVRDRAVFLDLLAAFAARIDERSQRLLQMLQAAPASLDSLVRQGLLYPSGYDELWVADAERRTIEQHLDELMTLGQVQQQGDGAYRVVHR